MFVVKRDGRKEPIMFDKITARIRKLNYGLNPLVDPVRVAMRVIEGLYDGVTTSELDNLAAEIAATMTTTPRLCKVGGQNFGIQPPQKHQKVVLRNDDRFISIHQPKNRKEGSFTFG